MYTYLLRFVQIGKAVAYPESQTGRGHTMVITARQARGLAQRLERAEAIVAAGAVRPVAGVEGFYAVEASDGSSVYLVEARDGRERCSCPDAQQRQQAAGLPCKHQLAVDLYRERASERQPVPANRPDPALGLAVLTGKRSAA